MKVNLKTVNTVRRWFTAALTRSITPGMRSDGSGDERGMKWQGGENAKHQQWASHILLCELRSFFSTKPSVEGVSLIFFILSLKRLLRWVNKAIEPILSHDKEFWCVILAISNSKSILTVWMFEATESWRVQTWDSYSDFYSLLDHSSLI